MNNIIVFIIVQFVQMLADNQNNKKL